MRSVPRMRVDVRFQETAVQSMCESKYYHRVGEADQISETKERTEDGSGRRRGNLSTTDASAGGVWRVRAT